MHHDSILLAVILPHLAIFEIRFEMLKALFLTLARRLRLIPSTFFPPCVFCATFILKIRYDESLMIYMEKLGQHREKP